MPTPSETKQRYTARFTKAFEVLIDALWDEADKAGFDRAMGYMQNAMSDVIKTAHHGAAPEPVRDNPFSLTQGKIQFGGESPLYDHPRSVEGMSPQKRGAQNRQKKGVVKNTIRDIISNSPHGISRAKIRETAQDAFGLSIKDGSLKQGLRLLKMSGAIENRDQLWFPTRNGPREGAV